MATILLSVLLSMGGILYEGTIPANETELRSIESDVVNNYDVQLEETFPLYALETRSIESDVMRMS